MFGIFVQALVFSYLALGVLYTEKIGFLNVSIEGISYLSIFLTSFFIYSGYGIFISTIFALFISFVFGFFLSFIVNKNYDIFIAGIGINIFCYFFVDYLMKRNFNFIPGFTLNLSGKFEVIAFIVIFFIFLFTTVYIISYSRIRVVFEFIFSGNYEDILGEKISNRFKSFAIFVSIFTASLAGSFIAVNLNAYSYNLGLNNGWLAICILYIAFSNPLLIFPISFLIVFFEYQFFHTQEYINSYFSLSLPFYVAIIINILVSLIKKKDKP
ncbi:ABC transporter permease [Borrelia sp. CA_690]|uniref:ABC transporter permease n=1 Tax=Borrelia maritima TaxID=2761123 RepID=A0A5J6WEN9_9SPIR|nr:MULTISPECIES: ABC transporter permease [Borrelia]QFI14449.1 ABC transporter permease [Borrelia maritima]WKC84304.1 ABC transporter permease [Borrelia sp. CA_690]